jgi:hypothetical protein
MTAEAMADDWPDCPPGCTLSCCVPTQEQSAEVAALLRRPPVEGGAF